MKDLLTLAIETSCDETAVAVVKNGRYVLSNIIDTQIPIHTRFGGLYDFPVFNFADIYICVACFLLIVVSFTKKEN